MKQKLKLGISTCPNDTYIYENLLKGLPHSPFEWEVSFGDVQTLNEKVLKGELDVAKVSCGVVPSILEHYTVLSSGGAIGYSCGPLLLSSSENSLVESSPVLLPGKNTTAALLFRFYSARKCKTLPPLEYALFDEVYRQIKSKKALQGVVIHEHRFTWKRDGLHLLADLGAYWETHVGFPIPLGCAVARREFSPDLIESIENEIRQSIKLAQNRKELVSPFIKKYAQIEEDSVIEAHIRTFVTDFSYSMGESGKNALKALFSVGK